MTGEQPGPGGSRSPTSPRRIGAARKQQQALELRLTGMTLDRIAAKLGYRSRSGAHKAIMSALAATLQEPAGEVRKMELERIDRLMERLWPLAKGSASRRPDLEALDRVVKLMAHRAKLLGLVTKEIAIGNAGGAAFKVYGGFDPEEV